jgi:hypothetical protein
MGEDVAVLDELIPLAPEDRPIPGLESRTVAGKWTLTAGRDYPF